MVFVGVGGREEFSIIIRGIASPSDQSGTSDGRGGWCSSGVDTEIASPPCGPEIVPGPVSGPPPIIRVRISSPIRRRDRPNASSCVWPSSVMDGTCRSAEMPVDAVSFPGCLSERAVLNSSLAGRVPDSVSSTSFFPMDSSSAPEWAGRSSSNGSYSHPSIGRPFNFGTCLSRVLSPYGFVPLGVTLGGGLRTREKGWGRGLWPKGFSPSRHFLGPIFWT